MLPSRGFFKKNDCPFFAKDLCIRPHCHFRHKKKVISENSSSVDSQEDLILSENLADNASKSICVEDTSVDISCTSSLKTQYSNIDSSSEKDNSRQDSLFAKLINQTNPYEKIKRHIPCAYTPTPQLKGVQPKSKSVSSKNNACDSEEILPKTVTIFDGYKSIGNSHHKCNRVQNLEQDSFSDIKLVKSNINQKTVTVVESQNNTLNSENSECKVSVLSDNSVFDYYEPQLTTKSSNGNLDKNNFQSFPSDYVPSKVTTLESQYVPNSSDSLLSCSYIPSKDKSKQSQYVPQSTGSIDSQVTYKPSDRTTLRETQYLPESNKCVANYVPTEKSATKTTSRSNNDCKNELTEIEFISSEIELMKALLKDDESEKRLEAGEPNSKANIVESKSKQEDSHSEKHKKLVSHHSASGKSKPDSSSHVHHSSKSKSSSSKHCSRSKNSRSDHHRSSSEKYRKSSTSSSSHEKSRSHRSLKSNKNKSGKRKNFDGYENKGKEILNKEKTEDEKPGDDSIEDGFSSGPEESPEKQDFIEVEHEDGSKKRKSTWESEDIQFKYFKKESEELFEDLEEDPATVEKECLEIFNNYSSETECNVSKKPNLLGPPPEDYERIIQTKKRTAHSALMTSDHSVLRHKTAKTVRNTIKSAQEVMLERYKVAEKNKESQALPPPLQPAPILGLSKPSIKIAAVSNIQQMLQAKKAIQEQINRGMKVNEKTTVAQTVSHGNSRVAHTPVSKEMIEKPTINVGSKQVPRIKRQIYLDKLLLETNQIYPTKGESAEEALKLEEEVFRANSGSSSAYHAAFVSMLLRTRRRVAAVKGETFKLNATRPKMSHYDVLSGGKKNFSVIKTKKVDISMLTDQHIYEELLRCKLSREELKENGYPTESDRPGYATCSLNFELKYNGKYLHIKKMTGNRRYCIRCSKQYDVDPVTWKQYKEGPETCCYHPGKKKSGGRNSDRIYNCCNSASSEGCTTHIRHVTDCNDYENLPNCVKTLSKKYETNPGVFALDCEMVYTRLGYELARVTVVNLKKEIVYDTLVKPKYPIECCNTLYSGIEEKMMEGVKTTLKDVQAVLLSMFSDKTILIGHSLDSDLRALHLIHDTVVDTAIFYKNEKYHPYKYSLKDLCAKKISKIIQDNVGGHDSAEDAVAALEIMLNHVKEEVSKYDSMESYEADRMS